jgi:phosphoribosylaminoimidazole (AIR) synthetase
MSLRKENLERSTAQEVLNEKHSGEINALEAKVRDLKVNNQNLTGIIQEIRAKIIAQQTISEDSQVIKIVSDTSHVEELERLRKVVQHLESVQEDNRAANSKIEELETALKISTEDNRALQNRLEQVNKISGNARITAEDVPPEHVQQPQPSELDEHVQQPKDCLKLGHLRQRGNQVVVQTLHDWV